MNVSLNAVLRSMAVSALEEGDFPALVAEVLAEMYTARILSVMKPEHLEEVESERLTTYTGTFFNTFLRADGPSWFSHGEYASGKSLDAQFVEHVRHLVGSCSSGNVSRLCLRSSDMKLYEQEAFKNDHVYET